MNSDIAEHVKGSSVYIDDMKEPAGTLHAAVIKSPSAKGKIRKTDFTHVLSSAGVKRIITAEDIPGENQIGNIVPDEPLLAEKEVHFIGMPIALVIADSHKHALAAAEKALVIVDEEKPVLDPREAYKKGSLIVPERTFSMGDPDKAFAECRFIVEGTASTGAQEHFYLETQAALAVPSESRNIKVFSSTQSPTSVQKVIARVLDLGMNQIEVDTLRLGGAFGGKEDQATPWAVLASLAAVKCKAPVKLVLPRKDDMVLTGKRHPYTSDYKLGIDENGRILAYKVFFYQNAGVFADLSPAILERTLFHVTASYFIPNVEAHAASCRTNLVPFTAFRGFGGPQAMFVIESALHRMSQVSGIPYHKLQKINLLKEGDIFPYGQKTEECHARKCFDRAWKLYGFDSCIKEVKDFNDSNRMIKKGFSLMPVCFGISFTNTMLNQAYALVHLYQDGTVGVSTGAVEMGQGVNRKIQIITAQTLNVSDKLVKIESTNTTRAANTSATAASCGSDLNGKAAEKAALVLKERLKAFCKDKMADCPLDSKDAVPDVLWAELVLNAYFDRISLSAQAHYATPDIWFDTEKEKGKPFAYHAYGTAGIMSTVNCLSGEYTIDKVMIVHDLGNSIDPAVDAGQIEGGLVQGMGWLTMEEFMVSENGSIITDNCSRYKVPDTMTSPDDVQIEILSDVPNSKAVFGSKAVGEPPFMYGIGAYFSILSAVQAFSPQTGIYDAPITPEKIVTGIYLNGERDG